MKDVRKTKEQLIDELVTMQERIAGLEVAEAERATGCVGGTVRRSASFES